MSDRSNPYADSDTQTALNKSDIDHLEKKMDKLQKKVNDTPSEEDFKQLENIIRKVLLEGNGNEPLTIKVAKNRNKLEHLDTRFNHLWAAVSGIFAFLGSITIKVYTNWF